MEHKAQQGIKNFKMNAGAFSQRAKAQFIIPTDPLERYECANQDCDSEDS